MIISFAGHSVIPSKEIIKEYVKEQIKKLLVSNEKVSCYLGGYGAFDEICAVACREIKSYYSDIELVYVSPYITLPEQEKIKELLRQGLYDTSIYPPIEKTPLRFAISKRNEWMMLHADIVIAYVNHNYGGAYKAIQIAKRSQKRIINICDHT